MTYKREKKTSYAEHVNSLLQSLSSSYRQMKREQAVDASSHSVRKPERERERERKRESETERESLHFPSLEQTVRLFFETEILMKCFIMTTLC